MRALFVLLVTLLFSLGCMGAVNSLTDLDLSVELGENAVHPADFPATAPVGGEKLMSMRMKASADSLNLPDGVEVDLGDGRYQMELVSYEVPSSGAAAAMQAARTQVESHGFHALADDGTAVTYEKDGALFVIVDPAANDDGALTLMRLVPVPEAEPSAQ
ncbi:MAG: hypothetical protein H6737_28095 [Alphaproteobacteria bacterium]|nr:hypothetical protein [Alphaproteobacteria bacterium]